MGQNRDDNLELTDLLLYAMEKMRRMPLPDPDLFKDQPGDDITGEGILLSVWEARDDSGNGIGKFFNIYAAPEDLIDYDCSKSPMTYTETVARLASLKNWHGHDGSSLKSSEYIYSALASDKYKGEWIIPPKQFFNSRDDQGRYSLYNSLLRCQDKGALRDTFNRESAEYWTSTAIYNVTIEGSGIRTMRNRINMKTKESNDSYDSSIRAFCRPVRLVEIK